MDTTPARRPSRDPRATVPADAPIRGWKPTILPREQYECLRLGVTIDELRASKARILAADAKEAGA